jgi:hypothetical protein
MTSISGPYDNHRRDNLVRLQAGVPQDLADDMFRRRFTLRGAQDRVIATMFQWFVDQVNHIEVPEGFDILNEQHATYILNELQQFKVARPDPSKLKRSTDC